ncbi:MAG: hypothetical protein JO307_12820, partial [Bryobacterales bacterium]|nr:hypothetical protein [Bryobacterales bacterium]
MKYVRSRNLYLGWLCCAATTWAQTTDVTELKAKMAQLQQMMQDLQQQIAAVEQGQKTPAIPKSQPASTPQPALISEPSPESPDQPLEATLPEDEDRKPHLDIYGFTMLDSGFDFKQVDPLWFDVVRPTKLPAFPNEFGKNGNWFMGVRQTRFGVRSFTPTLLGELKTIFEFELFGTGIDAGQTTFRLRHAWGEIWKIGAGQTWSPFMDPDVFPNSIEYWGPNGMVFFRNVQFRFTPWSKGDSNVMIAAERPGASGDQGVYADRIELQGIKPRFPAPDISGHVRWGGSK